VESLCSADDPGLLAEARRALLLCGQLNADTDADPDWHVANGLVADGEARYEDADAHLRRALELAPRDQLARLQRVKTLEKLGDRQRAQAVHAEFVAHGDPFKFG
jgi:Flp pilus assembly protein TadD